MQYQDLSLKKLQVAAFDWDNTLAYSREALVFAINKVLPQYNLPEWDIIQHKRNRRLSFRDNFPLIFGDKADEAYEKYRIIYKENVKNLISAPPKAREVLQFLKERGVKIAIVSNKDRLLFEFERPFLYDENLFDIIVCGHEAKQDKPNGEQLKFAVCKLIDRITPESVWMIGDSPMDSECALSAHAKAIRIGEPIWDTADNACSNNITFIKDFAAFYDILTEQS